eukprot:scaffold39245_cov45-Cyclotella_meneghiniana.AAC.1
MAAGQGHKAAAGMLNGKDNGCRLVGNAIGVLASRTDLTLRVRCDSRTFRAYSNLKPKENPSRGPPDLKVSPRTYHLPKACKSLPLSPPALCTCTWDDERSHLRSVENLLPSEQ